MNIYHELFRKLKKKIFRILVRIYLINMSDSKSANISIKVTMPFPLTVTIDDVGRENSWRDNQSKHVLEDYDNLVYIGENVGTRLMCAFMVAYFDKSNICAKYPTTTKFGRDWDNMKNLDIQENIMQYVSKNAAYIEYGLHGVDHRMYWDPHLVPDGFGGPNKQPFKHYGEWYDVGGAKPWNSIAVEEHIHAFDEISKQYGFSFPRSMVPPHHAYYYNSKSDKSTAALIVKHGLKYVTTDFYKIPELLPREGIDHGVLLTHRDSGDLPHDAIGITPKNLVDTTSFMTHFANFYAKNPKDNKIVADKWVEWLNIKIKNNPNRYIPKNNAQLNSQWLYHKYSTIDMVNDAIVIDNSKMPAEAYEYDLIGNLVLKVALLEDQHVSYTDLDGGHIAGYYEDRGYGYIILPRLNKSVHKLHFILGSTYMREYILHEGTYNVFSFESTEDECAIELEMFGTQTLKVKIMFEAKKVTSSNPNVLVQSYDYNSEECLFIICLKASDIQGDITTINISA